MGEHALRRVGFKGSCRTPAAIAPGGLASQRQQCSPKLEPSSLDNMAWEIESITRPCDRCYLEAGQWGLPFLALTTQGFGRFLRFTKAGRSEFRGVARPQQRSLSVAH